MKNLAIKILVLTAGLAGGVSASDLPDCVGDDYASWDNCVGTFTFPDGDRYNGGDKYVGEWKYGSRTGQGTYTTVGGDKYVGGFKDGTFDLQGTYTSAGGDTYAGEWDDGWRTGQGTYTYAGGDTYAGEWNYNTKNGQGTFTYANGGKYVGEFRGGKKNGQGTYTSTDRTIREGIWEDDEFLGTVAEVEREERARIAAEEKAERIYNACLVDKSSVTDMSVSSVEKAVEATCRSIAKDPSFLEGFRYD